MCTFHMNVHECHVSSTLPPVGCVKAVPHQPAGRVVAHGVPVQEAEIEKLKRMTPAQRQKHEDRQKRIEMGRAMKKRTVRV